MSELEQSLKSELEFIWAAHTSVGLEGFMAVYTDPTQDVWRSKDAGQRLMFGPDQTDEAIAFVLKHYNDGKLPNSSPLLNPIIHHKQADGSYIPVGSGVFWSTAFTLGIAKLSDDQERRPRDLGIFTSHMHRGEEKKTGLKLLGVSKTALPVTPDGRTVTGCREVYELTDIQSDMYWPFYIFSGMSYLCMHGLFNHPSWASMLPENLTGKPASEVVKDTAIDIQSLIDANTCWNSYDRHPTLYDRFGTDTNNIEHNNRFYNLCARDLHLFDRTGPMRKGAEEKFEFVVPGYIPRGAVSLLAAAGGTGKSSVAHMLCVMSSIDYRPDEEAPVWLGQTLNPEVTKGICVYFSGEDGPAIINARGQLFDPEGRAQRLQFHRTEFQDQEMSFGDYLRGLMKMPDVSIVVIDPARKYLNGDENDADVVSEFFEAIEEFAIRKNCAMLVVHHLQKGANPQSVREVRDELRGSQVFIDRPRCILGMYRDDKHTVMGVAKTNIPPNLGMVLDERKFTRNPKNLRLIWLPEETKKAFLEEDELQRLEAEEFQKLADEAKAAAEKK